MSLKASQNFLNGLINLIDVLFTIDLMENPHLLVKVDQWRVQFNVDV